MAGNRLKVPLLVLATVVLAGCETVDVVASRIPDAAPANDRGIDAADAADGAAESAPDASSDASTGPAPDAGEPIPVCDDRGPRLRVGDGYG